LLEFTEDGTADRRRRFRTDAIEFLARLELDAR
jgi:hypothetical protein